MIAAVSAARYTTDGNDGVGEPRLELVVLERLGGLDLVERPFQQVHGDPGHERRRSHQYQLAEAAGPDGVAQDDHGRMTVSSWAVPARKARTPAEASAAILTSSLDAASIDDGATATSPKSNASRIRLNTSRATSDGWRTHASLSPSWRIGGG